MKPLQTHGRYVETWVPPQERFVRYEKSDERWARPLGIGTVERRLQDLYDVRDEQFGLLGYTYHNPVMESPRQLIELAFLEDCESLWRADSHAPSKVREIAVRTKVCGFRGERFVHWAVALEDAGFLIESGWICAFGCDNKYEWMHELKRRQHERDDIRRGVSPKYLVMSPEDRNSCNESFQALLNLHYGLGG